MKPTKRAKWHGVAHGRQPGGADGADQKISGGQDEVRHREGAPEADAVSYCPAENRQEPDHAAEDAGQGPGLLGGETQFLLQVQGKGSERAVVGKALENLGDVGDPEGTLEARAYFLPALRKAQDDLLAVAASGRPPATVPRQRQRSGRRCGSPCFGWLSPAAMVTDERGTFKSMAKKSTQASLAFPSTGGAARATFSASPISPVRAFFRARMDLDHEGGAGTDALQSNHSLFTTESQRRREIQEGKINKSQA